MVAKFGGSSSASFWPQWQADSSRFERSLRSQKRARAAIPCRWLRLQLHLQVVQAAPVLVAQQLAAAEAREIGHGHAAALRQRGEQRVPQVAPGRDSVQQNDWRAAPHVDEGRLHEGNLHAELGQIVAGLKPGRERDDETILFWHRGLSTSDIALGCALLDKAKRVGRGQTLRFQ